MKLECNEVERRVTGTLVCYSSVRPENGWTLLYDIVFKGIGRPYRQRHTFIGIRIESTAKGCPGLLLFP